MSSPDTIAAVSTASGQAAISLIRVSGSESISIIKKIFKPRGKRAFPLSYSAYHGDLIDPKTGEIADKVVVTTYLAPKSYTGEHVVEISTHGNAVVVTRVMSILLATGARAAEAGEFTRRAFINGKMDLLDVEAVSQLLSAQSVSQASIALNQLEGLPSAYINKIRDEIIQQLVQLEASLNFPEDAIEAIDEHHLAHRLNEIYQQLEIFVNNANNGSLVSGGLKLAITGKPNSGKSSILNMLLGKERAIVTNIAGTTRDTLEENINIGSVPLKLIDTAGIRKPGDEIEALGIERTNASINDAFAVLGVFDASSKETTEDLEILAKLKKLDKPVIYLLNKNDLPAKISKQFFNGLRTISISAKTNDGMVALSKEIETILQERGIKDFDQMVLLTSQQTLALNKAHSAIKRACDGIGEIYQDMLAIELEEAVSELGRIIGETVDLNTLDLIFERFCIGK